MTAISKIVIEIGVPQQGTPSVYLIKIIRRDSAGEVETSLAPDARMIVLKTIIHFLGALLE